jgi:adenylate cyclase
MRHVGVTGTGHLDFAFTAFLLFLPAVAIVSGLVFGSLHYFFEKYLRRKIPLWQLMLRLCVDQLLIISILTIIYYFAISMMQMNRLTFLEFLQSADAFVYYLYVFLVNSTLSMLIEITTLLGRGNFLKLVTGKFYNPKEEYRVFMFLDMNYSTTIAEKLGHIKYSNFLKDCFYDLAVVRRHNAEIYQYVGDEAVLTWRRSKMKYVTECIDAFWAFNDELLKKSDQYYNNYGIVPEFKAGLSIGMVTVVEIGAVKKEIAYHGNTLNTTSRIVDMCHVYSQKLLMSKKLYDEIVKEDSSYIYEWVAEAKLRGKQGTTEIYSINRTMPVIINDEKKLMDS